MKKAWLVLTAGLLSAIPPGPALAQSPPALDDVLARYVDAVGGRAAIERLTTRVILARIVTDLPTREPPVLETDTLEVYSRAPGQHFLVQRTARGTMLEGCDGATRWRRDFHGKTFEIGEGDPRSAWLLDPHFPLHLRELFPRMELMGRADLDGRVVFVVDTDGRETHRLYFDAETGLLVRYGYNRKAMDYREVDGVLLPFRVEYSRKGGASTFHLDSVVHGAALDDSLFAKPADL
jgi:hypothetical protein